MSAREEEVLANEGTDFERTDLDLRALALLAVATLLLLVVGPLALTFIYSQAVPDVPRQPTVEPPAPRLQLSPEADLTRFRDAEAARLGSYGWVDRSKGIVHIPIEQAMREIARRGIPDFGKPAK
jgi:hypothetical protein